MNRAIRLTVFLLLGIFISVIAEKATPHSHIERDGIIMPDWNHESDSSEDEDSESLHHSIYQLSSFDFSLEESVILNLSVHEVSLNITLEKVVIADYNILPKILNNILFIVHTYSSTSPPLYFN